MMIIWVKMISGEVNRDLALQLACQVVRIYGMEAMLDMGECNEQLLPLLVHLSSIEVRMILEDPNAEQVRDSISHTLCSIPLGQCNVLYCF